MTAKKATPSASAPRSVDARYFFIVLVPIAVFLTEKIISDFLMAPVVSVPPDILSGENQWLEAAGRYRFLAATWFFAALTVLAVWLLVRKLMDSITSQTRLAALVTWFIVVALALSPTVMKYVGFGGSPTYDVVGKDLFEAALSGGALPGCATADDTWLLGRCGESPAISLFNAVLDIINLLAGLAVGALIVGMILCLATRRASDVEEEAELLAENLRQMRQQLYLASVVLTFGMFFVTSWMNWPLPLIAGAEQEAFGSLARSAALFSGTFFTLLLLSFYLPVAFLLHERARRLSKKVAEGKVASIDIADWMANHGLREGVGEYLRTGLAISAPILSAFAGGVTPFPI